MLYNPPFAKLWLPQSSGAVVIPCTHQWSGAAGMTPTANRLYAFPVYIGSPTSVSALVAGLVTAATSAGTFCKYTMAVYRDNGGTPNGGPIVIDAGISGATALAVSAPAPLSLTVSPAVVLAPGWYWLVFLANWDYGGAPALRTVTIAGDGFPLGLNNTLGTGTGTAPSSANNAGFQLSGVTFPVTSMTASWPVFPTAAIASALSSMAVGLVVT